MTHLYDRIMLCLMAVSICTVNGGCHADRVCSTSRGCGELNVVLGWYWYCDSGCCMLGHISGYWAKSNDESRLDLNSFSDPKNFSVIALLVIC
eukprot:UN13686